MLAPVQVYKVLENIIVQALPGADKYYITKLLKINIDALDLIAKMVNGGDAEARRVLIEYLHEHKKQLQEMTLAEDERRSYDQNIKKFSAEYNSTKEQFSATHREIINRKINYLITEVAPVQYN